MPSASFYASNGADQKRARFSHRILVIVIAGLALLAIASAFVIFAEIDALMEQNAAAASDNRTWVVSQLEVDLVKFTSSVIEARISAGSPGVLEEVRTNFDILYSRISLIGQSAVLQDSPLHRSAEWAALVGPDGLMRAWVPLIDGPDNQLREALPMLHQDFRELRPGIRTAVVDSVFSVMGQGDMMRLSLRETLRGFASATYGLLFGLFSLMIWLFFQSRSRTEHARVLELALQNLRMTISAAPDAVMIVNGEGRVVAANTAANAILGQGDAYSKPVSDVFQMDAADPTTQSFDDLLPGLRHRLTARRADGTQFEAEVTLGQGRTEFNELITVVFLRDITEQIAYEQTLAKARNDAMAADDAKARFLAVMSHEMRTPLNGLLSAVDLLLRTTRLNTEQDWLVDIIRTCGQTTLEQVNNVLLLAKMSNAEGGEHPAAPVRLSRFLTEIAQEFAADARRAGNSLTLVGTDTPSSLVMLPLPLVRRAVGNLLSNAVKFTSNGKITVALTETPASTPGRVAIRITVTDTGIGIAAEDIDRIFRNFETLDVSYARVREGSGLGLGIAKLSIEEIGGQVETRSELGKGSCFSLVFEAALSDQMPQDHAVSDDACDLDATSLGGVKVLIADDNALNRTLMGRQLETLGAQVMLAANGAEAVDKARETLFDIILMDISMPVVDGIQATRMIRDAGVSRDVPVIAVTAQASRSRATEFRVAGMQDVVTKPASVQEVVAAIRALVPEAPLSDAGGNPPPPACTTPSIPVADACDAAHDEAMPTAEPAQNPAFAALVEDLGPEFMTMMVARFREDTTTALSAARQASATGDLAALHAVTHSAAGAAAAIGLAGLSAILRRVEDHATERQGAAVAALLSEAEAIFARDIESLRL